MTCNSSNSKNSCKTDLECVKDVYLITKEKLPYTIYKSGIYKLCGDLTFQPTLSGTSAITLVENVKDVVIDFQGYRLRMSSFAFTADNFGILINPNATNITIKNGTIEGFSASQIRGYNSLDTIIICDMILEGISQAHGGNRLTNEKVASAINFGPIVETPVEIPPIPVLPPPEMPISNNIQLKNIKISNINLNNLIIPDQFLWAVGLFYCNDIKIDDVYVSELTHSGLIQKGASTLIGFGFYACTNSISRFSVANDMTATNPNSGSNVAGDSYGVVYEFCDRVENYDCSYSNNIGTRRGGGIGWVSSNDFVAERCVADSNIVVDPTASGVASHYGFEAVGIPALGLPLCQRGIIKNCKVLNQPTAFVAGGIIDAIFENCEAIAGNLPSSSTVLVEGFQATNTSNGVTFKNCIATGFAVPNPTTEGGFRIIGNSTNINIINCKSTKNSIGIFVNAGSTNVVLDSNEVAFNTEFGIQDTTPIQTPNLYIRNVAYANAVNYSVNTANPSFALVQPNQAASFPLYTNPNASPLSNLDIQP